MKKPTLKKEIKSGRMLKNTGSWMYCGSCNKAIGYLCYSTYQHFNFKFSCLCGNIGSFDLSFQADNKIESSKEILLKKKNRLCCPKDEAPLFTIVGKHLETYSYSVTCNTCYTQFKDNSKK